MGKKGGRVLGRFDRFRKKKQIGLEIRKKRPSSEMPQMTESIMRSIKNREQLAQKHQPKKNAITDQLIQLQCHTRKKKRKKNPKISRIPS